MMDVLMFLFWWLLPGVALLAMFTLAIVNCSSCPPSWLQEEENSSKKIKGKASDTALKADVEAGAKAELKESDRRESRARHASKSALKLKQPGGSKMLKYKRASPGRRPLLSRNKLQMHERVNLVSNPLFRAQVAIAGQKLEPVKSSVASDGRGGSSSLSNVSKSSNSNTGKSHFVPMNTQSFVLEASKCPSEVNKASDNTSTSIIKEVAEQKM